MEMVCWREQRCPVVTPRLPACPLDWSLKTYKSEKGPAEGRRERDASIRARKGFVEINLSMRLCLQYPGAAEGEVPRCCTLQERQGEHRVLRAGQDAAPPRRHHHAARQGFHHQAHHLVPQATRLLRPRGPTVVARRPAAQEQQG